jgi:hypothetical protein
MQTSRRTAVAIGLAAMCAAGLTAQTQETKTTTNTKIELKGGKDVTLIGCLDRNSNGDYLLTRVPTNRRKEASQYTLITSEDLSKHVGERIEIRGKVVVNGNGTVSVESTTKTEVDNGTDRETKAKTEGAIGALDMPFLGVTSTKTLGSLCN